MAIACRSGFSREGNNEFWSRGSHSTDFPVSQVLTVYSVMFHSSSGPCMMLLSVLRFL